MESIISITTLGLAFIVLGWVVQAFKGKNKTGIQKNFLTWYGLGVLILILDGVFNGQMLAPTLNLVVFIMVIMVMIREKK